MDLINKIPVIVRYFFVGGIAALTDLVIFFVLAKQYEFNYLLVSIIGFFVATFVNYTLSIIFVFSSGVRFQRFSEIILVYAVSSIALVVHLSSLYLFISFFHEGKMFSKVIAILCAFMFNYLLRKYYVFKKQQS